MVLLERYERWCTCIASSFRAPTWTLSPTPLLPAISPGSQHATPSGEQLVALDAELEDARPLDAEFDELLRDVMDDVRCSLEVRWGRGREAYSKFNIPGLGGVRATCEPCIL